MADNFLSNVCIIESWVKDHGNWFLTVTCYSQESINHIGNTCQKNQKYIDNGSKIKNETIIGYRNLVGDRVVFQKIQAYNYEAPYEGPYKITLMCTNKMVTLKVGVTTDGINICCIESYHR